MNRPSEIQIVQKSPPLPKTQVRDVTVANLEGIFSS
jgi:hypothetical protein